MNNKPKIICGITNMDGSPAEKTEEEIQQFKSMMSNKGEYDVIYMPYIIKNTKTTINNQTVWHSNKVINFFIKLKFLFFPWKKPKRFKEYSNKKINKDFYGKIK